MMANVTNYAKHGYFHGIKNLPDRTAFIIFCKRRSGDIIKNFGNTPTHDELMAKIYYQGLTDGMELRK